MKQQLSLAYLSACLLVPFSLADLTGTNSALVCNKGIFTNNKASTETQREIDITQEHCAVVRGTCEDCFENCSTYTDTILRIKDLDISGPFNISWTVISNGEETSYLMKYGLQQYNGILLMYYTMLHFPVTELPSEGPYSVILQCQTRGFARVRVTMLVPTGNKTQDFNHKFSLAENTGKVSNSGSVPFTVKAKNIDENQSETKAANTGLMVVVVLAAVLALTLVIITSVVCMRRAAAKSTKNAVNGNLHQVSNNLGSNNDQEIDGTYRQHLHLTVTGTDSFQTQDNTGSQYRHDSSFTGGFRENIGDPYKHYSDTNEEVQDDYGFTQRSNLSPIPLNFHYPQVTNIISNETKLSGEYNSCLGQYMETCPHEKQYSSNIQEQIKAINSDTYILQFSHNLSPLSC